MPLTTISLRTGTSPEYRRAIADGIHQAMIDALGIPADDRFVLVLEHAPENMIQDPVFFGVERSERSVFIQIMVNQRPVEQKQALYRLIIDNLTRAPGIRMEDIFIGVVEVARENWWAYARQVNATGVDDRTGESRS
jgi:phenylpyruvate tautomerase PptA (4-oxalocrotonate tautomerase family)